MSENYSISTVTLETEQQKKFQEVVDALPKILAKLKNPDYDEIFGYRINVAGKPHVDELQRNEILLKFLIANEYDVEKAIESIVKTLDWRNKFQPLKAAFSEKFDDELNQLGLITDTKENSPNHKVITWNLYGNLKSPEKLFAKFGGDSATDSEGSQFLRWRIGLMEKSLSLIDFTDKENNKIAQVHDYNGASMFRMDPGMKSATKEIISIFQDNYPELLSVKLFVNVPYIMGWVFTFFKMIGLIGAATLAKFQMLSHGDLREWFKQTPPGYSGDKRATNEEVFKFDSSSKSEISAYGKELLAQVEAKKSAAKEAATETAAEETVVEETATEKA